MQILATTTLVVLLGAGTPGPVPERFGPATAVVVIGRDPDVTDR